MMLPCNQSRLVEDHLTSSVVVAFSHRRFSNKEASTFALHTLEYLSQ